MKKIKVSICDLLKKKSQPIGYVIVSHDESHDLGYGLRQTYWGQGIVAYLHGASATELNEKKCRPHSCFLP